MRSDTEEPMESCVDYDSSKSTSSEQPEESEVY